MTNVTVKGRRLAASNSKWEVHFDHLVDQRGNEVPDYLVLEPRVSRDDHVTGVSVLPVLDGRLVLIRTYRHALRTDLWEVPRGFLDAGETPAEAALRELTEETGLRCAPVDLVPLGHFAPEPSTVAGRAKLFAATRCEGILRQPVDEIGLGQLQAMSPAEVSDLIASGRIEESGTLILYYRYSALRP